MLSCRSGISLPDRDAPRFCECAVRCFLTLAEHDRGAVWLMKATRVALPIWQFSRAASTTNDGHELINMV